jgi:hypothetical protein
MAKALPRCRPFGHSTHHKPHRPLIVEFGKGMTGGRSREGREGPDLPVPPVVCRFRAYSKNIQGG